MKKIKKIQVNDTLTHIRKRMKQLLKIHIENILIIFLVMTTCIVFLLRLNGFCIFKIGNNKIEILGTLVESFTAIFAIVFSISLVTIERYSEEHSKLIIGLYFINLNFIVPFVLNFITMLFNLFLFLNISLHYLIDYDLILVFAAIFSLCIFFIYTIRFLMVENVVEMLLRRLKIKPRLLSRNFAEEEAYRKYLQPIEEIIIRNIKLKQYSSAKYLIDYINEKMESALIVVKEIMARSRDRDQSIVQLVRFMSLPFHRLFKAIATFANKSDAFEITERIIKIIVAFIEDFDDNRFLPAFKIFDPLTDRIYSQARLIFDPEEYKIDLARLGVLIADAEVKFSEYME